MDPVHACTKQRERVERTLPILGEMLTADRDIRSAVSSTSVFLRRGGPAERAPRKSACEQSEEHIAASAGTEEGVPDDSCSTCPIGMPSGHKADLFRVDFFPGSRGIAQFWRWGDDDAFKNTNVVSSVVKIQLVGLPPADADARSLWHERPEGPRGAGRQCIPSLPAAVLARAGLFMTRRRLRLADAVTAAVATHVDRPIQHPSRCSRLLLSRF